VSSDSAEDGDFHVGTSRPNPPSFSSNKGAKWLKELHLFIVSVNARPNVVVEVQLKNEDGQYPSW